jgi:ferric-dicitrate binding protein FerR (iron transport regulator)
MAHEGLATMSNDQDDPNLARWIRAASPYSKPSTQGRTEAFNAVQREWQAALREKSKPTKIATPPHRRWWPAALAAGIVLAISVLSPFMLERSVVAQVADVRGAGGSIRSSGIKALWDARRPLTEGEILREGEHIETGPATRVRIALAPDLSVRVADNTRLQLTSGDQFDLTSGALYVESTPRTDGSETPLTVSTVVGEVAHLGTRYLVSLSEAQLQVSVREGLVKFDAENGASHLASTGQRLAISRTDFAVNFDEVDAFDPAFQWLADIPAPLGNGSLLLTDFFNWYEKETGRPIVLKSSDPALEPTQVRLQGNVQGLSPDEALNVVALSSDIGIERQTNRILVYPSSNR